MTLMKVTVIDSIKIQEEFSVLRLHLPEKASEMFLPLLACHTQ